jgi:DNA-directed RNA polymerase subunit RPC12/RpoP
MKFDEFTKLFPDEDSCIKYFRELKESRGIVCPHCGSTQFYWSNLYKSHDCKQCSFRITLRSGTIMESSHLPFHYWFYTMYLMVMFKKSVSALEVQRQLGHKRYEPIWYMMHKIRTVMGARDNKYELDGVVELDDAFFKTHSDKAKKTKTKPGRGSENQSTVLVMAKVVPQRGRPKKYKKSSALRFVKMEVISNSSSGQINKKVSEYVASVSTVKSDAWRGFKRLREVITDHIQKVIPPKEASKVLPWVHTMISNAKRNLLGTNHQIKDEYLQNYLNEFCYKTNRRYFGTNLFERLVATSVEDTWYGKKKY